jgi:hypothetical protein
MLHFKTCWQQFRRWQRARDLTYRCFVVCNQAKDFSGVVHRGGGIIIVFSSTRADVHDSPNNGRPLCIVLAPSEKNTQASAASTTLWSCQTMPGLKEVKPRLVAQSFHQVSEKSLPKPGANAKFLSKRGANAKFVTKPLLHPH